MVNMACNYKKNKKNKDVIIFYAVLLVSLLGFVTIIFFPGVL